MWTGLPRQFDQWGGDLLARAAPATLLGAIRWGVVVVGLMAVSAAAGAVMATSTSSPRLYRDGACIAMDIATAYGFLDEPKRKIVTRAIADAANPYAGRFAGGYRALTEACESVAENRWRGW
jgi:hypothetical protein